MKKKIIFAMVVLGCVLAARRVFSQEEYKTEDDEARAYNVTRIIKTVEGLHFSVETDRPIEKIAGVYRPIDIDSYIALKFNKLDTKFTDLISDLEKSIEDLAQKVESLTLKVEELTSPKTAPPTNETTATNP